MCLLLPGLALPQTSSTDPATDLLKQGNDALASQRYEDAVKAFKKASQLRHDACGECYFDLAVAQTKLGELEEAVKSCDKAISRATDERLRAASHTLKGKLLQNMGDDPKKLAAAESEYRAALQIERESAIAHLNLGVVLLRESQDPEGFQELNSYLRLAPDRQDANYARKLLSNPRRAGEPLAPDFEVRTLDGEEISLSQLAGKIIVMDFWATWCSPCVQSVPELKELAKKYPRTKLVVISISADENQQAWRDFVAKKNMNWPQYWDGDGRIRNKFAVNSFPTYLVVDPEGFLHQRIVGLNPQQSIVFRLKDTLRAMLPQE